MSTTGGRRRPVALALALVAGTAISVSACSSGGGADGTNFVSDPTGTITVLAPDQRQQPVALSGTTLTGETLDLASLRGKVVVMNVWGSWCTPCRVEAPALAAAAKELEGQGVAFVGINTRDPDPAPALAFEKSFDVPYPSLVDQGGKLLLALRGAVPPKAIPTTLVLDGEGRIAARISGSTTKVTLKNVVQDVLAGRTSVSTQAPTTNPSASPSA